MPKQLIVQFTPIRSCLVNLPSQWVNALLDQRKVSTQNTIQRNGEEQVKPLTAATTCRGKH